MGPNANKQFITRILHRLEEKYPTITTPLKHSSAHELLFATILSAQCTDARVNMVTPTLFAKYKNIKDYANSDINELKAIIRTTGFYNNKAKNIINCAKKIMSDYDGEVPDRMEELIKLPGVARKTANVVLAHWFHKNEGMAIDTHMIRLTNRYGIVDTKDPVKIEQILMKLVPREEWGDFAIRLILYGREVCTARGHSCKCCLLDDKI